MTPGTTGLNFVLSLNLERFESPSEPETAPSTEVYADEVETNGDSGIGISTLTILAEDFFFLAEERAVEVKTVRFSPRAFLNFSSYLFSFL